MKRILAVILAVIFVFAMMTACSSGSKKKSKATEKPTEQATEVTEAPTEEETEEPTEEETEEPTEEPKIEPTEKLTEKPTESPDEFLYTDPAGVYQLMVPKIWKETGEIIEDTDTNGNESVRFVYKDAYKQGAGHVFTIVLVEDPSKIVDVTQFPHAKDIFNNGSTQVYAVYPTDVQFAPKSAPGTAEFEKQQKEYSELSNTKEEIIKSFTFRDL